MTASSGCERSLEAVFDQPFFVQFKPAEFSRLAIWLAELHMTVFCLFLRNA
jgi:hypothetical protein